MSTEEPRRPEGRLIRAARRRAALSIAAAAARTAAGDRPALGPDQWANNERGYSSKAKGRDVVPPAWTLARMAEAVGTTPEELEEAGRGDAAAELRKNVQARPAGSEVPDEGADRLIAMLVSEPVPDHHRKVLEFLWEDMDGEGRLKPRADRIASMITWIETRMRRDTGEGGAVVRSL